MWLNIIFTLIHLFVGIQNYVYRVFIVKVPFL